MRAVSYDINVNAFPEGIEFTNDLPQIYFLPAYNKRPPFKKYIGEGLAGSILLYTEKHADIKFKFPVDVSNIGKPRTDLPPPTQQSEEINVKKEDEVKSDEPQEYYPPMDEDSYQEEIPIPNSDL